MIEPEVAYMDLEGDMQLAKAFLTPHRQPQSSPTTASTLLTVIGRDIASARGRHRAGSHLHSRALSYDEAHAMLDM